MEKKEVKTGEPFTTDEITIVPVVETSLYYRQGKRILLYSGTSRAVGVVVVTPSATRAFRADGEEISIEQMNKEVPGIKKTLDNI